MNLGVQRGNKGKKVTFTDICFWLAGFGSLIFWYANGISGNDFWWHVKVGEYICQNGKIPTADIFSWLRFEMEIPWTAHEWLSEVILYFLYSCGGEVGVFLFFFVLACIIYFLIYGQIREYANNNWAISGIFLFLFTIILPMFFFGRPHVFGFFLFFFELKLLFAFFDNEGGKQIWFIPVLTILWSNLHGGSSNLAYLLCLTFLFAGSFRFSIGRVESSKLSKKAQRMLGLVTLCTIGASFANPIGYKVFVYPYVNLSDKLSMKMISEWQSPDVKSIGQLLLFFFPILLLSMGIVLEEQRIRFLDLIIMLLFLFLFLRSIRFIIFWYIAASFYAFRYLPTFGTQTGKRKLRTITGGVGLIMGLLMGISGLPAMLTTIQSNKIIKTVLDEVMIQTIKEASPTRLFNDYDFGEALIFHDIPVFYDSRADLFSKMGILAEGFSLTQMQNINLDEASNKLDIDGILNKYQFDYFLVDETTPIYVYLSDHVESFELLYEENEVAFFRVTCNN